ncbi:MAG TPA: cache domain-containing protein, partial [Anaerolineales bacterium]|nr:cache domain-containing protein [Anaerolineales bacterium]
MILPDSIYGRLRLTFIGLATVPLLVVGLALTWTTYTTQRNQVLDLQQELALRIGSEVDAYIRSLESQLKITSEVTSLASLSQDQEEQDKILANLRAENNNRFAELALLNQNGMEVVVNKYNEVVLPEEYKNRSDDAEFKFFLDNPQGTVYYGQVVPTSASGSGPLMKIAIPLREPQSGSLKHVLVATVRFQEIWDILARDDLGEGESIYIVDQLDQVVGHNNPSIALSGENFPPPDEKGLYTGLANTSVLMGIDRRSFPEVGNGQGEQEEGRQLFTIIAETPVSGVLRLALNAWIVILGLIFVAIAVANVLALAAARNITRPIQELAAVAEGIRGGDLAQRASTSGLRELDTLANTFNQMTAELRQTLESLEQRVADRTQALRTSAEVSRYLSTILDTDQLVAEVANRVQSAFDYYHVIIYLFDQNAENLVLVAATGESSQALLGEQYQVPKDEGLIGKAAAVNLPVLAADVTQNQDWRPNPWLPETRGELVIPIARGAQVLGVLDIQQDVVDKSNQ